MALLKIALSYFQFISGRFFAFCKEDNLLFNAKSRENMPKKLKRTSVSI